MKTGAVGSVDASALATGKVSAEELEQEDLVLPSELPSDPGSALVLLQRMVAGLRDTGISTGKARVQTADDGAKKAIEDVYKEKHEQFVEEVNRTFWDDIGDVFSEIGKWVGAVASSVAAVMSFGAATPLAVLAVSGAILSGLSTIDSTFGISEALLGKEAAMWLNLGMSVGGALMSGGASIGSALSKGTEAATAAASATKAAVKMGTGAANVAAAGAKGAAACANLAAAGHQYAADISAAEETAALQRQQRFERMADAITETIRDVVTKKDRQLAAIGNLMSDWTATQVALVKA